jgi:NTE family protein
MQPMLRHIEVIEAVRRSHRPSRWAAPRSTADARLALHRFHLIEAGRFTGALAPESRAKPDIELLTYLYEAGRSETEKWLARHRDSIGRTETADLGARFLAPRV